MSNSPSLASRAPSSSALTALWTHFESGNQKALAGLLCRLSRGGAERLLDSFRGHPLADDWSDFATESLRAHLAHRRGLVYIVANPVNVGLYKLGQTRDSLDARVKSLKTAGVVGYFVPLMAIDVNDRFAVEAAAHRQLALAFPRHKEFFQCDWEAVQASLAAAVSREAEAWNRLIGCIY